MNRQHEANDQKPMLRPEQPGPASCEVPTLPKRFNLNVPCPDLPEKMLLVIDGWNDTCKLAVGRCLAKELGGLLVNSEDVFHALVVSSLNEGIDINDDTRLESWCERAAVDIAFCVGIGTPWTANVSVNGAWFNNEELVGMPKVISPPARDIFWRKVRQAVCQCDFEDRVVVVGSDLGSEFPAAPFKFFLDDTRTKRDSLELAAVTYPFAGDARNYPDAMSPTAFDHSNKSVFIDTGRVGFGDVVCIVLMESVARAHKLGLIGGQYDEALAAAYFRADALRDEINKRR